MSFVICAISVNVTTHHGCHVFGWIMRLKGVVEWHPRIARGMTLIECVEPELLPVCPNLFKALSGRARFVSLDEHLHLVYDGFLLLPSPYAGHRSDHGWNLPTGARGHHLLLIDGDAVSQVFLHAGNVVLDFRRVFLAGDEFGDIVHWSRTIKAFMAIRSSNTVGAARADISACRQTRTGTPMVLPSQ